MKKEIYDVTGTITLLFLPINMFVLAFWLMNYPTSFSWTYVPVITVSIFFSAIYLMNKFAPEKQLTIDKYT